MPRVADVSDESAEDPPGMSRAAHGRPRAHDGRPVQLRAESRIRSHECLIKARSRGRRVSRRLREVDTAATAAARSNHRLKQDRASLEVLHGYLIAISTSMK